MTVGTIKTQGTELFLIDSLSTSHAALVKMSCPTGITGLGGPADQLEDTCLDSTDKTFIAGLKTPGAISVPFNMIPSAHSQQLLYQLKDAGLKLPFMIAFSDGTALPTITAGGAFIPPASPQRTSVEFIGYVSDVNIDVATNAVVKGTLTIQRSGPLTWHWNGPTPTI